MLAPTGQLVWVADEAELDAVTALSGSGPAYVFYLARGDAARPAARWAWPSKARELALADLRRRAALAAASSDSARALRERVTSNGGTTHAAMTPLEAPASGGAHRALAARDAPRARRRVRRPLA